MDDSAHDWSDPDGAAEAAAPARPRASPLVRRLAAERGIDLATLSGSGPNGRIVEADLPAPEGAASSAPAPEGAASSAPAPRAAAPGAQAAKPSRMAPTIALRQRVASARLEMLVEILGDSHGATPLWAFAAKALGRALPSVEAVAVSTDLAEWRALSAPGTRALGAGQAARGNGAAAVALAVLPHAPEALPLPAGRTLMLAIGPAAVRCPRCEDAALDLLLVADPDHWTPDQAAATLSDVAAMLERPGPLLSGLPEV
ncbi:branched-chain alpha-keto acid dehydrogenase subunit E2 [Roseivivax jejudonensis]|uniref:Branched-chain alpha-keto acid dehydrogenase subunit E2 n=1 Tax=Roseivivax jejudonensis TaxID=1529041 RepID=A0A1X6ZIB5_9RHOB|nr:E3 binding domain-containing protein [Roseivivax jejudonensis]SLN50505.1 branched-chain alpha-keto acid dehydrogenase subunit E2 [Roseivivax jejudonensis]